MRTTVNITPVKVFTYTADKLIYQITGVSIEHQYADFHWELCGGGGLLLQGSIRMGGDDYQGWNNDLPYITNWVCKQLQVEQVPVVETLTIESEVTALEVVVDSEPAQIENSEVIVTEPIADIDETVVTTEATEPAEDTPSSP